MTRVGRRAVCGHIEHPSDGLPDLRKFAVVLTDVGYIDKFPGMREELIAQGEDPETAVIGEFEALPTPDGKIVEALWEANVETGASSRAQGSVIRNEGAKYPAFPADADIVQDDVDRETIVWDIVARPSTPGAFPRAVREAINEAQESRRKLLKEQQVAETHYSPPANRGDTVMDLTEIRTRLSRLEPKLGSLSIQPKGNLTEYLKELDALNEGLFSARSGITDSAALDLAASMKGKIQHHRDEIIEVITAAMNEADPTPLSGAKGLSVARSPSVDELDVLPTVGKKGQNLGPGGAEGQGHIEDPEGTSNDGTPPGPGVKPGVKVPAGETGQKHGKIIGTESRGGAANLDEEGSKKIPGAKGMHVAYDTKNKQTSRRGKKVKDLQGIVASDQPEGDEEIVQEMGIGSHPMRRRRKSRDEMGYSHDEMGHDEMDHDEDDDYEEMGDMDMESLANLNTGLVNENRGLRRENQHIKKQLKAAKTLAVNTGKRYREEQFKTSMERIIEANSALDTAQCRSALKTAQDVQGMVGLAEAMLGTRVRMHNEEEVNVEIGLEEDGFYRVLVNGDAYGQIFDGDTLYKALQSMGIAENDIAASFAKAHGVDYEQSIGMAEIAERDGVDDYAHDDDDDMGGEDDFGFGDEEGDDELDLGMDVDDIEGGEEGGEGQKFQVPPEVADSPDAQAYVMVPMNPVEGKKSKSGFVTMMENLNRASGGSRENLTEGAPAAKPRNRGKPTSQKRKIEEAVLPVGVRRGKKKPPQMGNPETAPLKGDGSVLMENVIARKKRGA